MKNESMNILFVSQLSGDRSVGPTYSVPAQVKAQMAFDHVYWLNLTNANLPEWNENGLVCHDINAVPNQKLSDLPAPFDAPDLVVFEEFYRFKPTGLTMEVFKKRIPYVIVPETDFELKVSDYDRKDCVPIFRHTGKRISQLHRNSRRQLCERGKKVIT